MSESTAENSPLAILQRLEGAQVAVRKDAETGKFLPKGETVATSSEPAKEPVAPEPQAEAPSVETTADPAMGKALTALRRAQTPQSVIDKLSDAERLEWGAKLAKQQADTDRLYRTKGKDSDPKAAEPDERDSSADSYELEDDSPEPDEQEEQESDPMALQMVALLASQARTQLAGEFPQLNDPKVWSEIRAAAIELHETGAYDDLSDDWSETAAVIVRDALAASSYRPSPSAPSPARTAGHKQVSKPEDRYAGMKGTPKPLLILQLIENEGLTPQRAHEIAKKLGA